MTPDEIEALVVRWMNTELEKTEDIRAQYHFDEEQRDLMADLAIDKFEESALFPARAANVVPVADELLKTAGLPPADHDSLAFKRLCRRLSFAQQEVLGIEIERWQNIYKTHTLPKSMGDQHEVTAATPVAPISPSFSIIVAKYLAENPRSKRTAEPVRIEFEKYIATLGGDRPIAEITKADGRKYREDLVQVRKVALGTVAQRVHTISGCFTWAKKMGYVPDGWPNPMEGLAPSKKEYTKTMQKRRPFTTEELVSIFSSPHFIKQRELAPPRYWVTLLCLYQLCRREEAAQLTLADVGEKAPIPFIVITDLGDGEHSNQSMKTPGSKRTIPIHSSLIALGFLDYVQSIRQTKQVRLFPQLTLVGKRYADPLGKWFARHLDSVGLAHPSLVMHSLRHGIHYLHALECPQDIAEMLTGHTASTVHNGYEHRELTTMTRLQAGLEKMQFPDVLKALGG